MVCYISSLAMLTVHSLFVTILQQTHQKNQIKDTIDVDEPEGMFYEISTYAVPHHFYV